MAMPYTKDWTKEDYHEHFKICKKSADSWFAFKGKEDHAEWNKMMNMCLANWFKDESMPASISMPALMTQTWERSDFID